MKKKHIALYLSYTHHVKKKSIELLSLFEVIHRSMDKL